MAKWVEVRVAPEHGTDALSALLERFKPDCAQWDPMPAKDAGLTADEAVAIRMQGVGERAARTFLERNGIAVLASKTLLHKPGLEGAHELGADSEARAGMAGGWSKLHGPGDPA